MKKLWLFIWLFFVLLSTSVHADTGTEYTNVQLDADKLSEANADLAQIEIDFCDKPWEKAITYPLAPGWIQDICLQANNMSDKDIVVTIGFVDGTVTNDQRKNKACMQQGEDKNFWHYVTGFTPSFTIPANDISFHHAKFFLPESATGIINWCLVYYTKSVEMWGGLNFSVLMRKAKFIDIIIRDKGVGTWNKGRGILFGVIILLLFFSKISGKTKKLAKRK